MYRVGTGSVCQAGLQNAWGTPATPDVLINMTGETLKVTVNKGDEGNLLARKTRDQADVMSVKVDGGLSTILRPEFADWAFEAVMGSKADNVFTLAAPNTELPVSTIVLSRGGIVKTYPDVTIKSIKISAAAQDYVKVDLDILGVKELSVGDEGTKTVQTLSFTLPSYRCTQATLKYAAGGTAKASISQSICVESCDITIDNGIEEAPATYCSGLFSGRPVMGRRTVWTYLFITVFYDVSINFLKSCGSVRFSPDTAFPDNDDFPARRFKFRNVSLISISVPCDLFFPETDIGLRQSVIPAALMPVPEASVDEDRRSVFGEDDVRVSG